MLYLEKVVAIIREVSGETRLLVVDKEADQYFQENKIPITEALIENGNGIAESTRVSHNTVAFSYTIFEITTTSQVSKKASIFIAVYYSKAKFFEKCFI